MRVPEMHPRLRARLLMRNTQACPEDQKRAVWPDLKADTQGGQNLGLGLATLLACDLLNLVVGQCQHRRGSRKDVEYFLSTKTIRGSAVKLNP